MQTLLTSLLTHHHNLRIYPILLFEIYVPGTQNYHILRLRSIWQQFLVITYMTTEIMLFLTISRFVTWINSWKEFTGNPNKLHRVSFSINMGIELRIKTVLSKQSKNYQNTILRATHCTAFFRFCIQVNLLCHHHISMTQILTYTYQTSIDLHM